MKLLCLAEKPSVARELQEAYKQYGCPMGIVEFSSFFGHVMGLPDADYYDEKFKKWDGTDLPIVPNFEYVPINKKAVSELLSKIKNGHYDALINACDAGREGEHIFYAFYEGSGLTLPVYRLWASDVTMETLGKALGNLLPESQFDGLRAAAKLRAKFDWLTGINLTRAATLSSQTKVVIGRVQSPTLKLLVDRENEIRNFVPKDFFEVKARFGIGSDTYDGVFFREDGETRFSKESEAQAIVNDIGKTATVKDVTAKKVSTKAPSLYSLVELQKDAAKMLGFKADKTLDIAQNLYEKLKLITYPRTESRALPTAMTGEIDQHIVVMAQIPELKPIVENLQQSKIDSVMKDKSYVDNAKVTDHHAIIPTKIKANINNMSKDELAVYTLICKRFLSIFMPAYVVEKTDVLTETETGKSFKSSGKVVVDPGYSILYPHNSKDVVLPPLKKGDTVSIKKAAVTKGTTKPPARYNTATLLAAMQNVGQQLSNAEMRKILRDTAGLGTSATRAEILSKLETYRLVTIQKNCFVPTDFAMAVVSSFGQSQTFSPELTADWEMKLRDVEEGKMQEQDFYNEVLSFVQEETEKFLNTKSNLKVLSWPIVGNCPFCGKPMRSFKDYFVCEDYKHGDTPCIGCFRKEFFGHTLSDPEMRNLLNGKTINVKMVTKEGKKWTGPIKIDIAEKRIKIAIEDSSNEEGEHGATKTKKEICTCPNCGGSIYKAKNYYLCTGRDEGCELLCKIDLFGYTVTEEDIKKICQDGTLGRKEKFVWKSGRSGFAIIVLKDGKIGFEF